MTRTSDRAQPELDDFAISRLREEGSMLVGDLYRTLKINFPLLKEQEVSDLVYRLAADGRAILEDVPIDSVLHYLSHWEWNIWFYLSIGTPPAAVIASVASLNTPLIILRWITGSALLVFMPGLAAVQALFPGGSELDVLERLGLVVGLSFTLDAFIGLLLNWTSVGITPLSVICSATVFVIPTTILAFYRRYNLARR